MFQNMLVLRNFGAEQGLHPGDLLIEFHEATLSAGTITVPTRFEAGQIIGVHCTHKHGTVNEAVAIACDGVVTSETVKLVGPTGSTAVVMVMIIGRANL